MITIAGKENISVRVIADSITQRGDRMTTLELEYPRFIHGEVMTHRMLSKNSASSRAIPVKTLRDHVINNTARPVFYGKNQAGMVAGESLDKITIETTKLLWDSARDSALTFANIMADMGNHKQVVNRLVEPYMLMKTIVSGTEWANLLWLRNHPDAQPEFQELARCINSALKKSSPKLMGVYHWHMPYVANKIENDTQSFWIDDTTQIDLDTARKISASCCAQVSYRKMDDSVEKALRVFDMLNLGRTDIPVHASPVEHQARVMPDIVSLQPDTWPEGVTHVDANCNFWSGNLRGWVQYRKLIPNEARW